MRLNPRTALLVTLLLLLAVPCDCTDTGRQAPCQVTGVSLFKAVRLERPTLIVTWTAPQSDVNITQYQVQYRKNGTFPSSQITVSGSPPATSTILTGLDAGTEYNVRVRARANFTDGEWSVEQTERTFDTPSRVIGVSLTKTVENGTSALRVTWTTPQSDLTISEYQVQYRRNGTTSWNSASPISGSPPVTSTILTGLDAGTEYNIRVRAVSAAGAGEWSVEQTNTTLDSESLCYMYSNCTDNTTRHVPTTTLPLTVTVVVPVVITVVLGVIVLVLLIVCTVALRVCLRRKQARMKRDIIGGDDCEHVNEYLMVQTGAEFCDLPKKLEMTTERTSADSLPEAQRHGYYNTNNTLQQIAVLQSHYEMEESMYWAPAATVIAIKDQLHQKTNHSLELQPESIALLEEVGEGEFGMVYKGEWADSPQGPLQVAVKSLHKQEEESRYKLLKEAAIMGQFNHPNVVRLYAVIDTPNKAMLVMEYLSKGDLLSHLITSRTSPVHHEEELPLQLLRFCQEIADAMQYLSKKGFIHRDLAARNILLNEEYAAKIADFGMSHDMEEDHYYKPKGGVIPVKWTAPEAVLYRRYTTKSDVWSYGMVMYEIWSLGHKPYEEFDIKQVLRALEIGYCQPPPPGCPRNIYKLMAECWNPDHHSRPTFEGITNHLARDREALLSWSEEDRTASPNAAVLGAPLEEGLHLYQELQEKYK